MNTKKLLTLGVIGAACITTNVHAQGLIYGEDIPQGLEYQYAFVENETQENAYTGLTSEEANALKISLEASGYTTVTIKSYLVKTGVITNTVNKEFASYDDAMAYVEDLKASGKTVTNVDFVNNTGISDEETFNQTFNTWEDANEALQAFLASHDIDATGEIKDVLTNEVIEEITDDKLYDTQNEANAALEAFLSDPANNTNSFYFTGTVTSSTETETTEIREHFNSAEEAQAYIDSLTQAGYKDISYTFTNDTEEQDDPYENTFDTREQAETALSEYNLLHNNVTSSITPVLDLTENTVENINRRFTSETEATNYYNEQLAKQSNDVDVDVVMQENTTAQQTIELEETYATEAEANARIAELSTIYDVVLTAEVVPYDAGAVYEAHRIVNYQDEYEIGNTIFLVNKHGNQLFVWTKNQLTAEQIAEFKRTYPSFEADPAISNVDNATFIYGLDSEYVTGNNKLFTIEERNGVLYAVMAPGSTSHIVYGEYVPQKEYHVVAKVHNNDKYWTVTGTITTKGYDYKLTAEGTKTVTLNSGTITGTKERDITHYYFTAQKKTKRHQVIASGKKTITLESGVLTATTTEDEMTEFFALDLVRQKFEFVGGVGDVGEEDNPNTSDESLWVFTIGGFSMIGLAATAQSFKKKED